MKKNMLDTIFYGSLFQEIKSKIRTAQIKASLSVNKEIVCLYWDIGRVIYLSQKKQGWSARIIPRLSQDIKNELPEIKGFSERNFGRMLSFYKNYSDLNLILPQPVAKTEKNSKLPQSVAKLQEVIFKIPWGHHALIIEKIKKIEIRIWYMQETIKNGWSRDILKIMIENKTHKRQGNTTNNFKLTLSPIQSDLVKQTLKDPYIFDFLTLSEPFTEREFETELLKHLEKFLIELGVGFAFVGRQYHIELEEDDFYIDLLFYHLKLRSFIVIDLKKGKFKPEYAGKMNFYCSVVDDLIRHKTDNPTIGLILCQDKNKIMAEYALRGINKPIGVSGYDLTRAVPAKLKSSLPSIEEIENELEKRGK